MKEVTIIGMGLGGGTVTREALDAIEQSDALLGAPRLLGMPEAQSSKPTFPIYAPAEVADFTARKSYQKIAVLVSGDVGFYSAAAGLADALKDCAVRCIPGVSTVSAFFARVKLPWQDAAFISAHGRGMNVADTVRRNRLTFCLTGNNAADSFAALRAAGLGYVKVHIGQDLGSASERVFETTADGAADATFPSLTVLLFVNDLFDGSVPCGLPDGRFLRSAGVPMTKSEVRALAISKLRLSPDSICWDVGAGTGSVTVETALGVYRGHVYAVERDEEAAELIKRNCEAFRIGNVSVIRGEAPAALAALPAPDRVFVGGSGGELGEIIDVALGKNPGALIVITSVTVETVQTAVSEFERRGMEPDITQINIARGRRAGRLHLLEAQNPVTIISAGGGQ